MSIPITPENHFGNIPFIQYHVVNTNLDGDPDALQQRGLYTLRNVMRTISKVVGMRRRTGSPQRQHVIIFNENGLEEYYEKLDGIKHLDNDLNLGYWTIQLNSPLPVIDQGSIKFNTKNKLSSDVQNVTLIPHADKKMTALLIQGSEKTGSPNVYLNRINFANFYAKGGDAKAGSGGGGGMGGGAAIVLRGGNLTVTNSVFQNNTAQGGNGASGAAGGDGSKVTIIKGDNSDGDVSRASSGGKGGNGAPPSIPYNGGNISGSEAQRIAQGGNAGYKFTNLTGKKGQDAMTGSFSHFSHGYGGNGGGGGGGASTMLQGPSPIYFGIGGSGGKGSKGGLGAGSGGGGGAGGGSYVKSKALGGAGGLAPYFGTPGANGGNSNNPGGDKIRQYGRTTWTTRSGGKGAKGGKGGDGSALGGAILVLDGSKNTDKSKDSKSQLNLWNVDFVNNKAISTSTAKSYNQLFQSPYYPTTETNILKTADDKLDNIVRYEDSNNNKASYPTALPLGKLDNANFYANPKIVDVELEQDNGMGTAPVHVGRSYITNPGVVKLREISQVLVNKSGISETNLINFDSAGSGKIGIKGDFSRLQREIKNIWKYLYPDNEQQINEQYESALMQSILETGISVASGGFGIAFPRTVTTDDEGKSSIVKNIAALAGSLMTGNFEKEQKLKQNAQRQERLREILSHNLNPTFDDIDTRRLRTKVIIKNFTLGEDIIEIPNIGKEAPDIKIAGDEKLKITLPYNNGEPNDLILIELDPRSYDLLPNKSKSEYLSGMWSQPDERNGSWKLGKYQVRAKRNVEDLYTGGPASTTVYNAREEEQKELYYKKSVRTYDGDDQIIGTDGYDFIQSGSGMDIIFPKGGADVINGGLGVDYVVLSDLEEPVEVVYNPSTSEFELPGNKTRGKRDNEESETFSTTLKNIEIIGVYAGSRVDYSALPEPSEINNWGARLGAGSQFTGSKYSDRVVLSFQSNEYNISSEINEIQVIDGGEGVNDTLEIDAPDDMDIRIENGKDCNSILIKRGDTVLNEIRNFEQLFYEGSDHSNELKVCSEGAFLNTTSHIAFGLNGADILHGGNYNDTLDGGNHDDILRGRSGDDKLFGSFGHDVLKGNSGHDNISGGHGNDSITGGVGSDTISGGRGSDTINGGSGDDKLIGRKGDDYFEISTGNDQIKDYNPDLDKILARSITSDLYIKDHAKGSLITDDSDINTLVEGISPSDISLY